MDLNNGLLPKIGNRLPRVYLDLSTSLTLFGDMAGGILRTEREIAHRLLANPKIDAVPIVISSGRIFALERTDALLIVGEPSRRALPAAENHELSARLAPPNMDEAPAADLVQAPPPIPLPRPMLVRAALRMGVRKAIDAMPEAIREDVRLALIHSREAVRKMLRPRHAVPDAALAAPVAPAHLAARDEMLLARGAIHDRAIEIGWPDSSEVLWTCGHYSEIVSLRTIAEARRRFGFSFVAVCYDLIRCEHPEWNPNEMTKIAWDCVTADLLDGADRILCISNYTQSRLLAFATRLGRDAPDTHVVKLGFDALPTVSETALPRQVSGGRFALNVGSVETRKNIGLLIRIWEDISDHPGFDLDLILVGRAAEWDETAVSAVEASPLLGQRIFWFDNCSDEVLGLLYRRADVLLYPSFTEGWGLPVTEALAVGTPVVASNGGAIPEAALGYAKLLPPSDQNAWRHAILELAASPPQRLPPIWPPTWDTTAAAVTTHLIDVAMAKTT